MNTKKRLPISRNSMWVGEETLKMFEELGMDYIGTQLNTSIILYRIDRVITNVDELYKETLPGNIRYETPIEIPCRYEIKQSKNASYVGSNQSARYKQTGNLSMFVYDRTLRELDVTIKYGDIIGVVVREDLMMYFEVFDDGERNFSNEESMWGMRPLYRTIMASELDPIVFNG